MKKILLIIAALLTLAAGRANAYDLSDYTFYPPFLPRVTSPNILFLLDYSKSMVRPAYGQCTAVSNTAGADNPSTSADESSCNNSTSSSCLSNCRTNFSNLTYDYDSATAYSGYYDNLYSGSGTYSDSSSSKYACSAGGSCSKSSSGAWNGNFLDWLTATQFDVLKKVVIGGDITPAPEQGNPTKIRSILTSGYTFRKLMNVGASTGSGASWTSCSSSYSPDCTSTTPTSTSTTSAWPSLTYDWVSCSGSCSATTLWTDSVGSGYDDNNSAVQTLPFAFTFYGNTYTQFVVSTNGWISFDTSLASQSGCNESAANCSNSALPATTGPNKLIAPYWDDLYVIGVGGGGGYTSKVYTFTAGSAPNRIFVVTWEKVRHYSATTNSTNAQTFQALLYEGSNHIVFQYNDVDTATKGGNSAYGRGRSATIGVENSSGNTAKQYSYCRGCSTDMVANSEAVFATPYISYTITPAGGTSSVTKFQAAQPLLPSLDRPTASGPYKTGNDDYNVNIDINSVLGYPNCASGSYPNSDRGTCYDHETTGLMQDFRDGELGGTIGFRLAIAQLNATDGATVSKHFNQKDTTGWSSLMSATRGQTPLTNTPLAEGLQTAEGYFKQDTSYRVPTTATSSQSWTNDGTGSTCASTGTNYDPYCFQSAAQRVSCCKSFVVMVSSGNYSNDNRTNIYGDAADTDGQLTSGGWSSTDDSGSEGTKANGGYLDNVAYKAHTTDWRSEMDATQNLTVYAVNTFGSVQTSLSSDITSSETTVSVSSTTGFPSSGSIQIDNEVISYTGATSTSFTGCTRGAASTTAASHTSGKKVYQAPVLDGAKILKKAAKYGGFSDDNGNSAYDSGEDDKNGDGDPDTYFEATGGGDLKNKIVSAVMDILKTSASGTSVSVLSTSAGGEGAIYQAYFYPAKVENETEERTWPGYMRSFFLDQYENLRDDTGSTAAKLDLTSDKIAQMCLDTTDNSIKVKLFADANGDGTTDVTATSNCPGTETSYATMDTVTSIWEAGNKLALRDKSTRKIYAWAPGAVSGASNTGGFSSLSGTPMDFNDANKTVLRPYLRASDDTESSNVISFVRGNAVSGYRNRCITVSGATQESGCTESNQRVWALGDIVYATPTLVSGPGEQYDQLYGTAAADYAAFSSKYKSRRRMVYVGGNDGMLHAFNAGTYDSSNVSFSANPTSGNGWTSPTPSLGDELWAFVPYDNLPHLAWLACNGTETDPSVCGASEYTHVFFVDGRPKATDVRIFNNSDSSCGTTTTSVLGLIDGQSGACHPGGWGTVLIVSMRLGGAEMDIDINGDSSISVNERFKSAYYAFDITDPEKKPKLLWRFNGIDDSTGEDKGLGFTTSYPAVVRVLPTVSCTDSGELSSSSEERWYMVVGSGSNDSTIPFDFKGSSTTATGKVFVVGLKDGKLKNSTDSTEFTGSTGDLNTYMGDATAVDKDFDFSVDVIYIGSSQGTGVTTVSGKVYRINTNMTCAKGWSTLSTLYNTDKPVLVTPSVSVDEDNKLWVFFGTGRLRSGGDNSDLTNGERQAFYGVRDECAGSCSTAYTGLYDATNLAVCASGAGGAIYSTTSSSGSCGSGTLLTNTTLSTLASTIKNSHGWQYNLGTTTPTERVLSRAAVLGGVVVFTTYKPVSDICSIFGDSTLYALYYKTGTAYDKPVLGTTGKTVNKSMSLGKGMPTPVGVAVGETVTGFVQKSTGEIVRIEAEPPQSIKSGASSWREKTGGGGTTEIETIYKHIIK